MDSLHALCPLIILIDALQPDHVNDSALTKMASIQVNRTILRRAVERGGFDAVVASNGAEALLAFQKQDKEDAGFLCILLVILPLSWNFSLSSQTYTPHPSTAHQHEQLPQQDLAPYMQKHQNCSQSGTCRISFKFCISYEEYSSAGHKHARNGWPGGGLDDTTDRKSL